MMTEMLDFEAIKSELIEWRAKLIEPESKQPAASSVWAVRACPPLSLGCAFPASIPLLRPIQLCTASAAAPRGAGTSGILTGLSPSCIARPIPRSGGVFRLTVPLLLRTGSRTTPSAGGCKSSA